MGKYSTAFAQTAKSVHLDDLLVSGWCRRFLGWWCVLS